MSRAISEMFDQDVALDDTENFEEVLYRITHVFDRLKNKKGAKDFIFGESIVDVCDDIVAQFPSLKKEQVTHFESIVDEALVNLWRKIESEYQKKSQALSNASNAFNSKAMGQIMGNFHELLQAAASDLAIALLGIEYTKIRPEHLKPSF